MTERDALPPELPVETTEGRRTGGAAGDRLILTIAGIALLGGVLVVAGKGLAGDPSSGPTSSAGASGVAATQRPSAQSTPRTRVVTVEDQPIPPPPAAAGPQFNGWIRARVDLPVYSSPGVDASSIGVIKKGALAYANEAQPESYSVEPGDRTLWLHVGYQQQDGFVTASRGATALVDRYEALPVPQPGYVLGLASSPDRLMAYGSRPSGADPWAPFVATSEDGVSWRLLDVGNLNGYALGGMAFGPAGWLALAYVDDPGSGERRSWLFASDDGFDWHVSGALVLTTDGRGLSTLVGGPNGYVLTIEQGPEVWHSIDGVTWSGQRITVPPPLAEGGISGPLSVLATEGGFYLYTGAGGWYGDTELHPSLGGFSSDGQAWHWHALPAGGSNLRVAALGKGLLGTDVSQVTGRQRAWTATIDGSDVTWTADKAATALLRNTGVSSMTSNGMQAMLFGWDMQSGDAVAFSAGSGGWSRVPLSADAFGRAAPFMSAATGDATFVALALHHNLFADNPVLWHGTPEGSWSPEERPILGSAAPPSNRADCPARRPANAVAFNILPSQWAAFCFGDQPMTFRAWVADCDGCFGGDQNMDMEPAWLLNSPNRIALSAVDVENDALMPATPAEGLVVKSEWAGHWVEVTGHYDDPASAMCRERVDPRNGSLQLPRQLTIDQCRQQFVVTAIRLVDGPGQR